MPHSWHFHCCHRSSLQLFAGKGVCNHTVGLLYQVTHYVIQNLSVVPPGVSKTAQPQQWHIHRSCCIRPDDVENLQLIHGSPGPSNKPTSVLREEGVRSTIYRAIPTALKDISVVHNFVNFLAPYGNMLSIQLLCALPADDEDVDLVDFVYGPVPKGSMLP